MDAERAAFAITSDAAQRIAGMIAARARGDLAGAETLLSGLDDRRRAAGAVFLADLAIALLAAAEDREPHDVASELSLQLASHAPQP